MGNVRPGFMRWLKRLVRWHELPLLLGLVIFWMALWREVSLLSAVSGVVVAVLAMRLFYLPPVELAGRFNVFWAVRLLLYFLWHLMLASAQVLWLAVRPAPPPVSGICEVRLRTSSDFLLTLTALIVSLIPGSLVVEVDRFGSGLYLHLLDADAAVSAERARAQVLRIEELVIRAFGSAPEVEQLSK